MVEFVNRLLVRMTAGEEEGQGMVEYGLIITFIALVVIASLFILGPKVANIYNQAGNQLVIP